MSTSNVSLTAGSLGGLGLGAGLGFVAFTTEHPLLLGLARLAEPVGALWTNAILMVLIPLLVSLIFVAIVGPADTRTAGKLGGLSALTFVVLLLCGGVFSLTVGRFLLTLLPLDPEGVEALRQSVTGAAASSAEPQVLSYAEWLVHLVPRNPFRALADGEMFSIVIATVLFSLASTRIAPEGREALVRLFRAVSDASIVLVRWILLLIPVGVFATVYPIAVATGSAMAGVLGAFVLATSALLLLFTALLYFVPVWFGRTPLRRFARGVLPAQAVAVATRSSLASLPPLIEGAEKTIGLPSSIAGLVLPLSVATFKVNRTISSPFQLMFMSYVFGVDLQVAPFVTFVLVMVLLSFGSPGVPSTGWVTFPFYVAMGVPPQGVVLFAGLNAVTDLFKTLANVTADMVVATVVARSSEDAVRGGASEGALLESSAKGH